MAENEINTVHVLIRKFLYEIDDVIKDKDASHKWLVSFAKTLQFQDLCKTPNDYALTLLREAKEFCLSQRKKSQIKQVRKILADEGNASPTKEQIETRWAELYGCESSETENEQPAAGDSTREASAPKAAPSHKVAAPAAGSPEPLWGYFQNVEITQEQFNELARYVGNVNECKELVNSFSANLADGTTTSKNHFATLKKWADARKRKDDSAPKSFKQMERDSRTEFFKKSVVGKLMEQERLEGRI